MTNCQICERVSPIASRLIYDAADIMDLRAVGVRLEDGVGRCVTGAWYLLSK